MTLRAAGFTPVPPGAKPGFDHADTYLGPGSAGRVYVAHTGADRVDVLDCESGAYLRAIPELPGVAGVLIDNAQDLLLTSDRAAGRVSVFRAADEGRIVVLDRDSGESLASLSLPGAPDVVLYDAALSRLYVAVGSPGAVSAFDTEGMTERETIATEEGAHTIGWDPRTRRLFVFQPRSGGVAIFNDS